MKLEQFISESLIQIVRGVQQAQTELKGTGARVSPQMRSTSHEHSIGQAEGDAGQPVSHVEFDVLVSVADEKGSKGGIGVVVGVIGLGAQGESESRKGQESRIRFKVPILLPIQKRDSG